MPPRGCCRVSTDAEVINSKGEIMNKQITETGQVVFNKAREFGNIREAQDWMNDYCIDNPAITAGMLYRTGLPQCETQDELDAFLYGDRND